MKQTVNVGRSLHEYEPVTPVLAARVVGKLDGTRKRESEPTTYNNDLA
jgi:hypothetical protein